jgi:hypothetical protein
MKSKTRAMTMMRITRAKVESIVLAVFDNYGLKGIGDILAKIRSGLKEVIDLFQLDDGDGILFLDEQVGDCGAHQLVGLVFEAIDFDAVLHHFVLVLVERLESLLEALGAVMDNLAKDRGWSE